VWFQRASDVMRKLRAGDLDLGIVGFDMFSELGQGDEDLIVIHDALSFGQCHLAVAVPQGWDNVNSMEDLKALGWTAARPMRVVTGYTHIAAKFFADAGMPHVALSTADGALEAAPAMGSADVILDLVSSGTTLRENNLKQIKGGRVLESQGCLVASRRALLHRPGALDVVRDMIERLEAHLRAEGQFLVTANMRGSSPAEVASALAAGGPLLTGLQGPTIGSIYTAPGAGGGAPAAGTFFSATLCVPRRQIYDAVKAMRRAGGSGVLVSPLTYIFDEEPPRWLALQRTLGIDNAQ
jgi:ATP phosphoribosyltransferase